MVLGGALRGFPLFEDLFLSMQATNLAIVDEFLRDDERQLLRNYIESERTPVQDAIFTAAISQLWVFGVYELLRTWRQRAREILRFADKVQALGSGRRRVLIAAKKRQLRESAPDRLSVAFLLRQFAKGAGDPKYAAKLRRAFDRTEMLFRRIEALRVSLAKHEVPKSKIPALAPGYSRIDETNGSIYWQIVLQGNEVDVVSRRAVSDEYRELAKDRRLPILPVRIQAEIRRFPKRSWFSYGVHRVAVTLQDGTERAGVFVAWEKQIVDFGDTRTPFDPESVVGVRLDQTGRAPATKPPRDAEE